LLKFLRVALERKPESKASTSIRRRSGLIYQQLFALELIIDRRRAAHPHASVPLSMWTKGPEGLPRIACSILRGVPSFLHSGGSRARNRFAIRLENRDHVPNHEHVGAPGTERSGLTITWPARSSGTPSDFRAETLLPPAAQITVRVGRNLPAHMHHPAIVNARLPSLKCHHLDSQPLQLAARAYCTE
jgi:hypothetical protein